MPVVNGTTYAERTPEEVIGLLEELRKSKQRIRLHYGQTEPSDSMPIGRDWLESWSVTGVIGRSMGPIKVPIMVANARSMGGPQLLDHCIVRIREARGGRDLYRHPQYSHGKVVIENIDEPWGQRRLTAAVKVDGVLHAQFETKQKALRWARKMGLELQEAIA